MFNKTQNINVFLSTAFVPNPLCSHRKGNQKAKKNTTSKRRRLDFIKRKLNHQFNKNSSEATQSFMIKGYLIMIKTIQYQSMEQKVESRKEEDR